MCKTYDEGGPNRGALKIPMPAPVCSRMRAWVQACGHADMQTCRHTWQHVYIYIYMYRERERDTYIRIHTQLCVCVHIYIYIYKRHADMQNSVYTHICVYICIYIYIYAYVYIHTYTHIYTHTHISLIRLIRRIRHAGMQACRRTRAHSRGHSAE